MGGDEHRGPSLVEDPYDVPEHVTGLRIKSCSRFVEEKNRGFVDERAQDDGLPLPSSGKVAGQFVQVRGEPDDLAQLHHPGLQLLAGYAVKDALGDYVLAYGDIHVKGQVLLAYTYELPGTLGIDGHVMTVQNYPAGGGPAHGGDGAGSGRLPSPVGAKETVYLPAPDGETDVIDSGEITELHGQSFDHDYVVWHSLSS